MKKQRGLKISNLYSAFINSERSAGILLIICTVISLVLANSGIAEKYLHLWHFEIFSRPVEFWVNDGLMTIFFLLVGLEIEREIYIGELSDIKKSLLPIFAAVGGMLVPALIHFFLNKGTETQSGFGIPMATDIAFSLAVLALLGKRVPLSLKVFLTALAIIDDLGAIIVIALFYSKDFSWLYFSLATGVFLFMFLLNRLKIYRIWVYLILGMIAWFFVYRSGIHATITGVLLAFVIPFEKGDKKSISYKLQHSLHLPVAFFILPLFALANTAITLPASAMNEIFTPNSYGIIFGLVIGKPVGIFLFSFLGIIAGLCYLPEGLRKRHILWTGMIAGIGFTMSIFITLLAFSDADTINVSKIAIIIGSTLAAVLGFIGLRFSLKKNQEEVTEE